MEGRGSGRGGKHCVCPGRAAAARLNPGLSKPLCESRPLDPERSGTPGYKRFVESLRCSDGQGCPPPSLWLLMVTPSLSYSQRLWRHPEPSYSARCVLSVMHDRAFPAAAPSPAGFRNPGLVTFSIVDKERKDKIFSWCNKALTVKYKLAKTTITSSAISSKALLLLSHRDLYMVVSFSSFLIFFVICGTIQIQIKSPSHKGFRDLFCVGKYVATPKTTCILCMNRLTVSLQGREVHSIIIQQSFTFSISCLNVVNTSLLLESVFWNSSNFSVYNESCKKDNIKNISASDLLQ